MGANIMLSAMRTRSLSAGHSPDDKEQPGRRCRSSRPLRESFPQRTLIALASKMGVNMRSGIRFAQVLLGLAFIGAADLQPAFAQAIQNQGCGLIEFEEPYPPRETWESFGCLQGQDARSSSPTGERATAVGSRSRASGAASTAYGHSANAAAPNSVAIGAGAQVAPGANGSVALGAGSYTTESGVVSVGRAGSERRITNVDRGVARTDAVNVSQLMELRSSVSQSLAAQQDQITALFDLRKLDRRDTSKGIAASLALTSAPMPSEPGKTSYAVNAATFRGEQALGVSVMHRVDTSNPFAIAAGFTYAGDNNNGARVGVAGEF